MKKLIQLNILIMMLVLLSACGSKEDTSGLVSNSLPTTLPVDLDVNPDGPVINSFIEPANGTYADGGGVLLFQVNFDEAVAVTGTPRMAIRLGLNTVYADYQTGSGTAGLEFSYAIQAGDNDSDGVSITSGTISLNGGSVNSVATDETANLNFLLYLDSLAGVLVNTSSGITPPDQVTGVTTAPTTSNTSLSVTWSVPNNNGTNLINYTVQYREQGNSTWLTTATPSANSTTMSGLTSGITYEIRIAANNGLLGSYSSISTAEIFDVMSLSPIAWLSATDITNGGTEPSNNDKVDQWEDLTGLASAATEINTSNQPTYLTNFQNNLPVVYFNNLDRGLEGTFNRTNGTDLTFIVVGQFNSGSTDKCLFEFKGPGNERGFFIDRRYASNTNYSPGITKDSLSLWRIEDNGSTATITENLSTQLFSGSTMFGTDFTGTGTYVLGDDATGGNRMNGYIAEFLIFDKALTPSEITILESYLKNKWGTP